MPKVKITLNPYPKIKQVANINYLESLQQKWKIYLNLTLKLNKKIEEDETLPWKKVWNRRGHKSCKWIHQAYLDGAINVLIGHA